MNRNDVIVITGFGPFGEHKVNASWQVVKAVIDLNLLADLKTMIIFEEIPVSYKFVSSEVPSKWFVNQCPPKVVVHVGVSGIAKKLTLEKVARNCGYEREDVEHCLPEDNRCVDCGDEELCTNFDVDKLVDLVNSHGSIDVKCEHSEDAGRYLCDFAFYKSLHVTKGNAIFIHVPPLGQPYSKEQLAQGIAVVVKGILQQISDNSS